MPDLSMRAWMTSAPPTIGPKESVKRALTVLRTAKVAELLVVDEGRVVGMVDERDIWEHCPTSALLLDDQQAEALLEQFRVGGVMALHPLSSPRLRRCPRLRNSWRSLGAQGSRWWKMACSLGS